MTNIEDPSEVLEDMPNLHPDCLHYVFQYLDYTDLMTASRTCKVWHDEAIFELKYSTSRCNGITIGKLIEDEKLIRFLKRMNLHTLDVSQMGVVVSDYIAEGIVDNCPNLKEFVANGYLQLTDRCLKTILGGCKVLKHLIINGSSPPNQFGNTSMGPNGHRANFRRLNVNSPNCEKENVLENVFRLCSNLETLEMSGLAAAKTPFVVEKMLPSLKVLRVSRENPGQEDPNDYFDSYFANVLEKTPNLQVLDVSGNFLGNHLFNLPMMCPNLVELDVGACNIYNPGHENTLDEFLQRMHSLRLTKLSCANFNYNREPYNFPSGISCFTGFLQLTELSLAHMFGLQNKHAVELIQKLPKLKSLDLAACPGVSRELEELLQEVPVLEKRDSEMGCDISWTNPEVNLFLPEFNIRILSQGY